MPEIDNILREKILIELERRSYPFPQFKFVKENGRLKQLGAGGFSVVYEAQGKENPDRKYAIKVGGTSKHDISSDNFKETSRLQRRLCEESPYVVRLISYKELLVLLDYDDNINDVIDTSAVNGGLYENVDRRCIKLQFVIMEKLEEVIVRDKMKNVSLTHLELYDEEKMIEFALQIGLALNTAHLDNILHRDVKLDNIFWDSKEQVFKLGDFGVAKCTVNGEASTILYTDGYGAPEIKKKSGMGYGATADIYSFGVVLYLLMNNLRFPLSKETYIATGEAQYAKDFVFPAAENASARMSGIIRKMCSYRPEDRYKSMGAVLKDLRYALEEIKQSRKQPQIEVDESLDMQTVTYRDDITDDSNVIEEKKYNDPQRVPQAPKHYESNECKELIEIKEIARDDDLQSEDGLDIDRDGDSDENEKENEKEYDGFDDLVYTGFERYRWGVWGYGVLIVLLIIFMLTGTVTRMPEINSWVFWGLAALVMFEAILQRLQQGHIMVGFVAVAALVYVMYTKGITLPYVMLAVAVLLGMPPVTASCSLGVAAWGLLNVTMKIQLPGFMERHDLGFLFFSGLIIVLCSFSFYRLDNWVDDANVGLTRVGISLLLPFLCVVTGIVLVVLDKTGRCDIPDQITRLHLIKAGVVALIGCLFVDNRNEYLLNYYLDDEEEEYEEENNLNEHE